MTCASGVVWVDAFASSESLIALESRNFQINVFLNRYLRMLEASPLSCLHEGELLDDLRREEAAEAGLLCDEVGGSLQYGDLDHAVVDCERGTVLADYLDWRPRILLPSFTVGFLIFVERSAEAIEVTHGFGAE